MRKTALIFWTVMIEAVRRREVYAIVLFASILIAVIGSIRFFDLASLSKFYREAALKVMGLATAATVIVLGARQLPREFERRTIYTLLAKPIGRASFLFGKFLGVVGSGVFCYALFMAIFLAGSWWLRSPIDAGLLAQHVYLQILGLCVIASLAFMLSLVGNLDMAITVSALVVLMAQMFTSALTFLYGYVGPAARFFFRVLNVVVPQLTLLDLSAKVVHGEIWDPVPAWVLGALTLYAGAFTAVFLTVSYLLFRRRAL